MSLRDYQSIHISTFVDIYVEKYRSNPNVGYTPTHLAFSDHYSDYDIDGQTFTALGNLMGIGTSVSELQTTSNTITISLSGVPNTANREIQSSVIKGSPVTIYRAFFEPDGTLITSADPTFTNPVGRFKGFVVNYSLNEEYDVINKTATNTITLECSSNVDTLAKKVAGRRTNEKSQKKYYPNDTSMDRVYKLQGRTFDFGAPK